MGYSDIRRSAPAHSSLQTAPVRHIALCIFAALSIVLPASAGAQDQPNDAETAAGAPTAKSRGLEEIVVRARKRDEFLEDTPVSVTALSSERLRIAGVTRIDEIGRMIPNLVFTRSFTGVDAEIKIRGVGTSAIDGIFDPGVGIYIDGVFLARTSGQLFDIVGIEQIEVLRGPQGTLFGKNTIGGAISVTTVKPHDEFELKASVRAGNYDSVTTRASLNIPLIEDRVLGRFSIGTRNFGGYTRNENLDLDYNDEAMQSFLGTIRLLPLDDQDLTIDITGTWGRQQGHGPGGQCRVVREQGLGTLELFDACRRTRPYSFTADAHGIQDLKNPGAWGVANWNFGEVGVLDNLALKGIASWRQQVIRNRIDLDNTSEPIGSLSANGGAAINGKEFDLTQTQAELQINTSALDERLNVVAGAFGLWEDQDATGVLNILDVIITPQRQQFDNWNWALYGQATGEITDWLSLTGGLRYTKEKKAATATDEVPFDSAGPFEPVTDRATFEAWTPMASISLRAPDDLLDHLGALDHVMTYFTYSKGFKGGGFNLATGSSAQDLEPFGPEKLEMFEVGVKTLAFDNRLTANVALFLGNYDDIQVTSIQANDPTDPTNFTRRTLNAAEATTQGIELEFQALPTDALLLAASFGYIDTEYDRFEGPDTIEIADTLVDRKGQSFNGVPDIQSNASIQYSIDVAPYDKDWLRGSLTPRLEWSYQSQIHWDFAELRDGFQRGFNLLNARLGYSFNDERTEVALWGNNITDEEYFTAVLSVANVAGTMNRYFAPPATYGVEISHDF